MDEIVIRAIAKWPNVPAVYGWLSLDRRGNWAIKGERIHNPLLAEFIARNYAHDERCRWFFQNGPQRVFVRLAYTPLVYRTCIRDGLAFLSHTGQGAERVLQVWLDEQGPLLIETELGIGVLHDQDLPEALAHLTGADGEPLADCSNRTASRRGCSVHRRPAGPARYRPRARAPVHYSGRRGRAPIPVRPRPPARAGRARVLTRRHLTRRRL